MEHIVLVLGLVYGIMGFIIAMSVIGLKFYEFKTNMAITAACCTGLVDCIRPMCDVLTEYIQEELAEDKQEERAVIDDYIRQEVSKRKPISMDDIEAEYLDPFDGDSGE